MRSAMSSASSALAPAGIQSVMTQHHRVRWMSRLPESLSSE
jgi:hypothetical protein